MNKMDFEENIFNAGHTKISTKYPIKDIKRIEEKFIVLLKIPSVELGKDELNNVLCYDKNGMFNWQISNKLPVSIKSKEQVPYIAIQIADGKLYAVDFWGRKFNVNLSNGELLDVRTVR